MAGRHFASIGILLCALLLTSSIHAAEKTLTIWSINPNTPFGSLTDKTAERFSREETGYSLKSVHFDNNYYKSHLRAALETGQSPDIFHNWGGSSIRGYVEAAEVVPIDSIIPELETRLMPIAFDPVSFGNHIYGIPYSGLAGVFFWYRKDVFERCNIQPPETWQQLIAAGEELKKNGIVPIALANKNKWPGSFFYMYLVDRLGGPQLFENAFIEKSRSFTDPAFVRAGKLVQDLVKRDFFPKGFNRMRDEPGNWNSLIISGQAGMYLMGTWFLSALKTLPEEIREKFDFFVFPEVDGGKGSSRSLVGSPGQDYLSIVADSPYRNGALSFLKEYIASPDYFKGLAELGFVPPIHNAEEFLTDPLSRKIARIYSKADHVQIYYDQIMPQNMAEAHKLLVHQLFELRLTPEQVAKSHADLLNSTQPESLSKSEADRLSK